MAYTTINKSTDYFNTITYTGNGTGSTARTVGFDPDWIWVKNRGGTDSHYLMDKVRGLDYNIETDTTAAQARDYLISGTTSTGWTSSNSGEINANNGTFVAWNWKANGAGSANTAGSINSTVSVNATSGFSIVKYTGTGSAATIGHGLGVAPACIIFKDLSASVDWFVYHQSTGATNRTKLNQTVASSASTFINNTAPSSTVFNTEGGGATGTNANNFIAYCFANKTGYSKFSSYTGNGNADGTFIYTGFKPAFIMVKRADDTSNWQINDNKRDVDNVQNTPLMANSSNAESTDTSWDALSNGFKMRQSYGSKNASGGTYIYMAFAEAPLVGSNNIPATAR
tara:strand:- start:1472 stop:2494 length:1023 start_codon:yes stop_codon:yes gene_type:complete